MPVLAFRLGHRFFQRVNIRRGFQILQSSLHRQIFFGQLLRLDPIFPRGRHQFLHPLFFGGQFIRVDFHAVNHIAQQVADFAQFCVNAVQHFQAFGKAWLDIAQRIQQAVAAARQRFHAVVSGHVFLRFIRGFQQFRRVGQAVVAAAERLPFAFFGI